MSRRLVPFPTEPFSTSMLMEGKIIVTYTVQNFLDPVVVVRYVRVRSGGFSSKDFFKIFFFKDFSGFLS